MSRVFIVQNQMERDGAGDLVPRFPTIYKAESYGKLVEILSPSAAPWGNDIVDEIKVVLADYDGDADFLLLIGNPALIGMCVAIAAQAPAARGRVQMLQWVGKREQRYFPIIAQGLALD